MHAFYLHGFASSPSSSKAAFFARKLAEHGIELQAPDLNLPDFSTLTVTRMLEQIRAAIDAVEGPVVLIGSSLGGFVAINAAVQRADRVKGLALMAPALDFGAPGAERAHKDAGMQLATWKASGHLDVFHYGYGRILPVHYALYEDAAHYDALDADLRMPIIVFQGRLDDTVDPATVEAWCARRAGCDLHLLDDGHQLTGSLPQMWDAFARFLGLS